MAIQMCDHHETERYISTCDCGQEVEACMDCLADDKVLCCGNCDCKEAVKMDDDSLYWCRKYIKTARKLSKAKAEETELRQKATELQQKESELKAEKWELERAKLYLKKIVAEKEENLENLEDV